ncbi:MAG: OB-fold nucleic acid binding domain-containing protein, partial [Spirochaetales bacterium]|nr:OB-fold nucleic acid binding domain-containing protein [Spirochaetales bacterium]
MEKRVLAADLARHGGERITVSGWVHRVRNLGGITFVMVRDRSGTAQLVYEAPPEFGNETVISVDGTVDANEKAPGGWELHVAETRVLAEADPDLPIAVNQDLGNVGIDAILDNRIVSLRNPRIRRIFELQAAILRYFAEWLRGEGFTEIKSSKIISSGTEGGTGLFSVDYFGERVYLAQSPQFYKQAMVASG